MIDLTGERFGKLTVKAIAGRKQGQYVWRCLCDCGKTTDYRGSVLRTGRAISCGCAKKVANLTHGKTASPEYAAWNNMKARCQRKTHVSYHLYGGRGIKVHQSWLERGGFAAFYAHLGPKPSPGHSLDRIDTNGDYEPGNVRWALPSTQARNTRTRHTNKSGVPGVRSTGATFLVSLQISTTDFFEACCIRKSLENRYWNTAVAN